MNAIYYHGGQSVLKMLPVMTTAYAQGKYAIIVNAQQEGAKWYYDAATTVAGLETVTAGSAITTANWTEVTANPMENITASTNKYVRVVCVDASNYPISVGDALINVGE